MKVKYLPLSSRLTGLPQFGYCLWPAMHREGTRLVFRAAMMNRYPFARALNGQCLWHKLGLQL